MGLNVSKDELIKNAIENQDVAQLRIQMKDLTPDQLRQIFCQRIPGEENQCTLLHYAAWQDNPDLLAPLLEYISDLEVRDGIGWTPLMSAVNRGSRENVKLLLAHGAKINCDHCKGLSLIADAMAFNDIELIKLLIENGAEVHNTESLVDGENTGYPLLHYAVDDGQMDMVKILIEKGKAPLNTHDELGWCPLHIAAGHGYLEICQLLVLKGADINAKDKDGNTPLAWARQMEATNVTSFLTHSGAIADSVWHGEPPKLKSYDEAEEEQEIIDYSHGDLEQNGGNKGGNKIERSHFEIETESPPPTKRNSSNNNIELDALQRKRNNPISTTNAERIKT